MSNDNHNDNVLSFPFEIQKCHLSPPKSMNIEQSLARDHQNRMVE